tara:strand:- start:5 stop:1078 length:1074 start_codon:yes stop_codon:yes gene_type:complete
MAYTTIDDPSAYFQIALYNGNAGTQSVVNDGNSDLQPDMVWIKCRSGTHATENHNLFDSVRGANKFFIPNGTTPSTTDTNSLTAFNSDGFSLGTRTDVNGSGAYCGWQWKAGGSASSNSNGNITSSVSANTTAGFSIVSWTGDNSGSATIGHGLGAIPDVVIIKNGTDATNWGVKHGSMSSGHMAVLNGTDPSSDRNGSTNGGIGNLTSSTTFGFIGGGAGVPEVNGSSDSMIAYCFTSIKGFSKHGSYTGNGNANGTFVYLGFRPAWVMFKRSDNTADWYIYDNKRNPFNVLDDRLEANNSGAEAGDGDAGNIVDYVSNGFKLRGTGGSMNDGTFVYMAFAESPFVTSTGIPTTAR